MTVLRNNFDGGPDGTDLTVANSGQVPGNDAFNLISTISSGSVIQYADASTLGRSTAEYVLKTSTSATAKDNAVLWSTAMGSQTQVWWRQYIYLTQLPVDAGMSAGIDMAIFECDNGAVYTGMVFIEHATGVLQVWDDLGPSLSASSTNAIPVDQWVRLEMRIQFSTTVGNWDLQLYIDDPDSDTPTETLSRTGWNLNAASANGFAFGSAFPQSNKPITYFSGLELNNTGWPGPAPFRAGKGVPGIMTNAIAIHTDTY